MKNLAGNPECDAEIIRELQKAGIVIVGHSYPLRNEVPASITGKLGTFTFTRAWYYWVVKGPVPLTVAREMYYNGGEIGRKDVRVAGHCGCPPPEDWLDTFYGSISFYNALGFDPAVKRENIDLLCRANDSAIRKLNPGIDPLRFGFRYTVPCISVYHIDSQEGLNLFVATLKKHDLV